MSTFDLLVGRDFLTALLYGAAAAAVVALLSTGARRRGRWPAPLAGLGMAAAAVLALGRVIDIPFEASLGLVLLAAGGLLGDLTRSTTLTLAAVLPGAWFLGARLSLPGPEWVPGFVVAAVVAGAALTADFDRRYAKDAFAVPALVLVVIGMFFTVPDTEQAVVLLGAALPFVFVAWPLPLARLGGAGGAAMVGLTMWIAVLGGHARPAAIVGAAAGLGLLVAEPIGRMVLRSKRTVLDELTGDPGGAVVVAGAQLLVVVGASRVAGLQRETLPAALIAAGLLALTAVVTGWRASGTRGARL